MIQPIASTSQLPLSALLLQNCKRSASTVATPSISTPSAAAAVPRKRLPYRGKLSKPNRIYTVKKRALFIEYNNLFKASPLILFFRPTHLTTQEYNAFRADVKKNSRSTPEEAARLQVTNLRSNILPPLLKTLKMPTQVLLPEIKHQIAVVTASDLDPPTLKSFLKVFDAHAKRLAKSRADAIKALPKSAQAKAQTGNKTNALDIIACFVDGKQQDVRAFSELPGLDGLRAMVVGILESQTRSLVGVMQQLAGGQLTATVEGRKLQLEEEEKGAAAPST